MSAVVYMWYDPRIKHESVLYVGSTVDFKHRRRVHRCSFRGKNMQPLHRACRDRYEHLKMEIIETCPAEKKLERETFWWDLLKPLFGRRPTGRTLEEKRRYKAEKVTCPICSSLVSRSYLYEHKKRRHTLKHN